MRIHHMHDILSTCDMSNEWHRKCLCNSATYIPLHASNILQKPYLYKGFLLYRQPPDPCAPVNETRMNEFLADDLNLNFRRIF